MDIIKPLKSAFINGKQVTTKLLTQKFLPSNDKMTFSVESNKSYFSVPPTLFPGSVGDPPSIKRSSIAVPQKKNSMWLRVKFQGKSCMIYEGDIYLTNMDKPNDIRVYKRKNYSENSYRK